jgi:hypothetical protein
MVHYVGLLTTGHCDSDLAIKDLLKQRFPGCKYRFHQFIWRTNERYRPDTQQQFNKFKQQFLKIGKLATMLQVQTSDKK